MSNTYKLPWNYEPGVNAALMTRTLDMSGEYSQDEYASIITDYASKYTGKYCFHTTNNEIVNVPYTIQVSVQRANDTQSQYVLISEDEQLKVTSVENNFYYVKYPAVQLTSFTNGWNAYTATPLGSYQLPKITIEDSSYWVDTSNLSNTTIAGDQMSKYFIPINTNINLNEEFRLRLRNFYTRINGLSYDLPNTYFVDNTNGNVAYSTYTSVLDVNPKVYDSNNNLVTGALTRVNGDWILNLNTIGTYTLYAYYCRQSKTLKPTGADDFDPNTNHDKIAWQVTLEVYNPSVRKVLNTTLYTYNQQGYNWLRYISGWELVDTPTSAQQILDVSQAGEAEALTIPFTYLNNVTWTTIGIDEYSLRGVNKQRSVKLHANLQFRKK